MAGRVPTSYLLAYGRTPEYFQKIQKGTAPTRFTTEFLENLGFKNKSDRSLIPVLKALNFLDDSNAPTQVYREYLDANRGKVALGRQILQAYEGLFELNRDAHKEKASDLRGSFKTLANASDDVADDMAQTFTNLCSIADIEGARSPKVAEKAKEAHPREEEIDHLHSAPTPGPIGLNYHIEIHLPNTTDIEVFRSIFKALKENIIK